MTPLRTRLVSVGMALATAAVLLMGCGEETSPETHPEKYDQLVRIAEAEARAGEDSTFLWLRNVEIDRARRLMLDLGLDFVRYDRPDGVICAWRGGGLNYARGFAHRMPGTTTPTDSIGEACFRSGPCQETPIKGRWTRWTCR